jgi:hypothetical protein
MTDLQINNLILDELRELRSSFNEHAQDVVQRLSKLETQSESIVGNGQPGRLTIVENKVGDLQHVQWLVRGIYIGVSALVSFITGYIYHQWK